MAYQEKNVDNFKIGLMKKRLEAEQEYNNLTIKREMGKPILIGA